MPSVFPRMNALLAAAARARFEFDPTPGTGDVCGDVQNAFLFAHELGHYLGLKHTFREVRHGALRRAGGRHQRWRLLPGD